MSNIEEKNKKPDYSKMTTRELLACRDEGANDQLRHLLQRKKTSARDLQRDLKADDMMMDIDMEDADQDKQKDNTDGEAVQHSEEPDPESKREEEARMIQRRLDALTSKKWSFVIDDEQKSGGHLDQQEVADDSQTDDEAGGNEAPGKEQEEGKKRAEGGENENDGEQKVEEGQGENTQKKPE